MAVTETLLTTAKESLLNWMNSNFLYLAVGTDGTSPSSGDTSLGSEVLRKERQEYELNTALGKFLVSMFIASTEANGSTLREVGIFDSSTDGNMFCREVFTDLNKTSSIEVWIDIEFTVEVSG